MCISLANATIRYSSCRSANEQVPLSQIYSSVIVLVSCSKAKSGTSVGLVKNILMFHLTQYLFLAQVRA